MIKLRKSIRLKNYDYSNSGYYYVTICSRNRRCYFGNIIDSKLMLNDSGIMLSTVWENMPLYNPGVKMDRFVIMPNHIHGIVILNGKSPKSKPLSDIIKQFKSLTTKKYIDGVKNHLWQSFDKKLWQRNYYEHIIRNEENTNKIRQYIIENPLKWAEDKNNPVNI